MFLDWILDRMDAYLTDILSSPIQIIALGAAIAAALLTITSSFVKTMVPLRWLAVCSNFGFFVSGVLQGTPVIALLHAILLPINMLRLRQMRRLTQNVRTAAAKTDTSGVWLRPYMKAKRRKAGEILFRKGDAADRLYLLASGRIEFVEIGVSVGPGTTFGEIAFFAPHGRRTSTARCAEDCTVMSLDQDTLRQIYFQNPSFGFELIGMVAGRLSADVARLEEQLAQAKAGVREL
jgi:CRP/FNR family transcriptional regulator, cyclic AMP receptor protein